MGGVMGICSGVFGIVWTIVAASVGGGIFALFGIVFIAVSVVTALYNFRNATGKNRYSAYDIVDGKEESDPLNERFSIKSNADDKLENEKYIVKLNANGDIESIFDKKINKELLFFGA